MPSFSQCRDFAETVLPNPDTILEEAIDWIKGNMTPDQVFDDDVLKEYVKANIEIDDVYPESNILTYVQGTWEPADVFDDHELAAWAENNGFVKE